MLPLPLMVSGCILHQYNVLAKQMNNARSHDTLYKTLYIPFLLFSIFGSPFHC